MNAFRPWALSLVVTAAAMAAACGPVAFAATPPAPAAPAAHAHDDHAAGARLHLNQGRKWGTDAPLRDGMTRIRAMVAPQLPAVHSGKLAPAEYAALAGKLEAEVGNIVANCKLPPEADAVLHVVISDLMAGTAAMAGQTPGAKAQEGFVKVVAAVNDYGRYFDHPGFQPIRTGH